jgi:hypothetical protein
MNTVAHVLLFIVGVVIVVMVLDAAIRSFVLPRGSVVSLTSIIARTWARIFTLFAPAKRGYEVRDRVFALYAPIVLISQPLVALLGVFAGFMCLFEALAGRGWREAFTMSGSSLLTLGFDRPPDLPSVALSFAEAAVGLALLALVIAYLPTIYSSFSRREVLVTDLAVRASIPPTPLVLLRRAHITGFLGSMDPFWDAWSMWFSEVRETHTTYSTLVHFRSPNPHQSWVTSAGAVLDSAAMRQSVVDIPWSPNAALCMRSGYLMLRDVAGFFGFDYDDDPAPDDPISVTREEFDELCQQLEGAGVPLHADRDQAWRDFAGWRVNYDGVLLALASFTLSPYAPWVSDRSPAHPLRRYPYGRRRREITRRAPKR